MAEASIAAAFARLRASTSTPAREAGARALAEAAGDGAAVWDEVINRHVLLLVADAPLAGLAAIDALLALDPRSPYRYWNAVSPLFLSHPGAAARTADAILRAGGAGFGEPFVDQEVPGAAELLGVPGAKGGERYAGVLVLTAIARHLPGPFGKHVDVVLEKLQVPLRDPRVYVREAAADLLALCLDILSNKGAPNGDALLARVFEQAKLGLQQSAQPDIVHGSLLTHAALLLHAKMFMRDSFVETASAIIHLKHAKHHPLILHTVIALVPVLAEYDTQTFVEHYLAASMDQLVAHLAVPADRDVAFRAIGRLARAVGSDVRPFLDRIMKHVRAALHSASLAHSSPYHSHPYPTTPTAAAAFLWPSISKEKDAKEREKDRSDATAAVFACVGMLVRSEVAPLVLGAVHELLDDMFACGLSRGLFEVLGYIAAALPALLRPIQVRMLDALARTLTGRPFVPCGAPPYDSDYIATNTKINGQTNVNGNGNQSPKTPSRKAHAPVQTQEKEKEKDADALVLALEILGSFDFSEHTLTEFIRDAALPYIAHPSPGVRRAAAQTCAALLLRDATVYHMSQHATGIVHEVLGCLVRVGVADPDPTIRADVLGALTERFDAHLAQAEHARGVLLAVHDAALPVRRAALALAGRLALLNPAYVLPALRGVVAQLIADLQHAPTSRARASAAGLLALATRSAGAHIAPYARQMLAVLLPATSSPAPAESTAALNAIGELAAVAGAEVQASGRLPEIMAAVLTALEDARPAAVGALGRVCGGTGFVVRPLVEYPALLPLLARMPGEEAVKVLGILGAVDPQRRAPLGEDDALAATVVRQGGIDVAVPLGGAAGEEYYLRVAVRALLEILENPLKDAAHHVAVEAIMSIFKTQGLSAVVFLPQIVPTFASVIRESTVRYQEFHLQQLAILVGIIGAHVRAYLPQLLELVHALWAAAPALRLALATLVEALARAMDSELGAFAPRLVPLLLAALDPAERPATRMHVLRALAPLAVCLAPYLALVLPAVVRATEEDGDWAVRRTAVGAVEAMAARVDMGAMLSLVVHPFVRALEGESEELREAVMDALAALAARAGADYALFVPLVDAAIKRHGIQHARYARVVARLVAGERAVDESELVLAHAQPAPAPEPAARAAQGVKTRVLRAVCDTSATADWHDWLHRLCAELLKESPSPALRSCLSLLHLDGPIAVELGRKLLPVSFLSVWVAVGPDYQDMMTAALETALTHPETPADVAVCVLELVESMERHNKPLAIPARVLSGAAAACGAYAAALHYMEHEFLATETPRAATVEAIIDVNTKLRQLDAAWGTLLLAREQFADFRQERWFEKLGRWEEALQGYSRADAGDEQSALGRMRCLNALGDWTGLARTAGEAYARCVGEVDARKTIAPLGAAAAWAMEDWDVLEDYVAGMDAEGGDRPFYAAVLAVHRARFESAAKHVSVARRLLEPELMPLLLDDYERGYEHLIRAQMLSELEEIVQYKQASDQPDRQHLLRQTWMKRLRGTQPDIEVWQRLLLVRSLVLDRQDATDMWIKFANLCRKSGRFELAEKTLSSLGGPDNSERADPDVIYSYMKFIWAAGERAEAQRSLADFSTELQRDLNRLVAQPVPANDPVMAENARAQARAAEKLLSRCYLKQAQWHIRGNSSWTEHNSQSVLDLISKATTLDSNWWKAWHMWALANIETLGSVEARADYHLDDVDGDILAARAVLAVDGLVHAISLAKKSTLQDVLRLVTLWFKFGGHDTVSRAIANSFTRLPVDTWLDVIPQIIARISAPNPLIRANIHVLMKEIGRQHPQPLIFPLTVASKSPSAPRQSSAIILIESMRNHDPTLVEQALLVSQELIRVAILWHELWREGLDTASKLYVDRGDIEGMLAVLDPLHDMVEAGPTTTDEMAFVHTHGRDLEGARQECRRYLRTGNPGDLERAWILYTQVYRRLERQPPQPILNLQQVSPYLLHARDLVLVVPGTYAANKPPLTIQKFSPQLTVLVKSNKKPRRFSVKSSDGQDYEYALKGHEDLRQDERVMQFFGLVNTLLANDSDSIKRRLHVQSLPVVPIAPNAGLIGWAQETDTLHYLIEQYRTSRDVLLNLENRLMLQMAPEYDYLTLMQKIEVFEHAMNSTTGMDLYRILWLKSSSASDWLSRRTTYTRSVALTSMLGYVIGLGDRHPSNILIHRLTGKIIHIDFGDCFEVAMHREKYPETVPFRLTRMMVNAMEISTIQGTFRNTSEIALRLMREHRDSLLAVLEALIYDPLISWRLIPHERRRTRSTASQDGPVQRMRANENEIFGDASGERISQQEIRNERALFVYNRVKNKLTGRDFNPNEVLSVQQQFNQLVHQARSDENLCRLYFGWVACW